MDRTQGDSIGDGRTFDKQLQLMLSNGAAAKS